MKSKLFFLFFFCFLSFLNTKAQTKQNSNTSLKEVLSMLEKKHDVKFSYSESLVSNQKISLSNLKEAIKIIEAKTDLIFQAVDKRYIIISDKNTLQKKKICGYVLKKNSKKPLVGASIINSNKLRGTFTDKKGYFEINLYNTKDHINVSFIGYKSIVRDLK